MNLYLSPHAIRCATCGYVRGWAGGGCSESVCVAGGYDGRRIMAEREQRRRWIEEEAARLRRCFKAGHDPLACLGHQAVAA